MKKLAVSLLLMISAAGLRAQSIDQYNAAMQKGIGMLDSAKTAEQFTAAANLFERVATAAPQFWLPQYYAGYSNLLAARLGTQPNDTKDALYDKAMVFADKANTLSANNSEILVLEGYITYLKMAVAPTERAMTMIPKANELLGKAAALNPNNPRVDLVRGQNTFFTPEAFGGGKVKAKEFLLKAWDKFEKDKPAGFDPHWGAARCQELLKQCD